jgi:exopolyphosphatase/guanosine-5'-triphosphate,3'-diphosphate pyrophosphatase
MRKFAVIDIGSNSVRLMFVADGKVLYKALCTTRLGEGLADTSMLSAAAIERSAKAVTDFYQSAISEGAEKVFAFATAAVRSAKNRAEFLSLVNTLCGLEIEVISGEEEAEIGILGALGKSDGGVVDVGGASTEIVVKKSEELIYKKSVDIGVVRLKDKCGRNYTALAETAKKAALSYGNIPFKGDITGIGGTATTLGALSLGLTKYDPDKVTGAAITAQEMKDLSEKLLAMSVEEIAALPCMPKGRADVLTGGAVLLVVLMETLGFERLIVSDRDNLEGYAIKRNLME